MQFRILGPLEVGGEPFRGGPKPRALLASLVLSRGSPVSKERLVDAVWGERPPASAAHALQVYVSELRKAGVEVERHGDGYRLQADRLDAAEFEGLLETAREHRRANRHEEALASLDEALALWRGPVLAGLEGGGALGAERERLEELRVAAMEDHAESALALGLALDVSELERLATEHPLRERLRAVLMLALYRAGRQAAALESYAEIRHALDELGLEPAAELRALQSSILRHDAALDVEPESVRERRHLPAPATPIVGRRDEVDTVTSLLRGESRLVTLTGPGGAGKTRVALRAAHELAGVFADGVWFVGLAALVDPALVRPAIAQTLGLAEESLEEELRGRETLLLLDNFEQLLDAAPGVSKLLEGAPRLRVLTTSRARLRLYGEHELEIPPLPAADAAELFVSRARAAGRELPGPLVAEICGRLDGLPLAIELVAARSSELTPTELMSSLDDRLELASRGARDLPERQQTLRAAIGWSHDLLGAHERRLFAHLGAFAGGFTSDAVRAVCGEDAAEQLAGLAEASLVRRAEDGRYRMLQTIREYAVERLVESGEAEEVRRRHADYFRELGEELVIALPTNAVDEVYATFEREHDNFRAALAFAGESGSSELRVRLAAAASQFWLVRGHLAEGRAWLEETLEAASGGEIPQLLRAQVLRKLATLEWRQGDFDVAGERAEAALPLLAGEVDEDERYRLLILLGCIEYSRQNREGSREWWEQSAALARTLENDAHLALALSNLGVVAAELEDYEGGVAIYEESVESAQRAEHREYLAGALLGLGDMNLRLRRFEVGRAQLAESMALYRRLGFQDRLASCCIWLAPAPEHDGDHAFAARLLGAAAGIRRQTGASIDWQEQELLDQLVERLRSSLGDGPYAVAFSAGEAAPDAVVEEVLASAAAAAPVAGQNVRPGR